MHVIFYEVSVCLAPKEIGVHNLSNRMDVTNLDHELDCAIDIRKNGEDNLEWGPFSQEDLPIRLVHEEVPMVENHSKYMKRSLADDLDEQSSQPLDTNLIGPSYR